MTHHLLCSSSLFYNKISGYDPLNLYILLLDYSNKANIPSINIRRLRSMAIETFKLSKLSPPVIIDLVNLRENNLYNFRYNNAPQVRTSKYGKSSFSLYAAAVLWNSFPGELRKVNNFNQFKSLISH